MAKSVKRISKKMKKSFRSKQRKTRVNKLRGGSTNPFYNNLSLEEKSAMERIRSAEQKHLAMKKDYEDSLVISKANKNEEINQLKKLIPQTKKEIDVLKIELANFEKEKSKIDNAYKAIPFTYNNKNNKARDIKMKMAQAQREFISQKKEPFILQNISNLTNQINNLSNELEGYQYKLKQLQSS